MRILALTPAVENKLLASRLLHDQKAEQRAARIVADVRRRGDPALFTWAKKLDGVSLTRRSLWISQREIREAGRSVAPDFLRALRQAARNIRFVAERQLPRPWSAVVEPGVRIEQRVVPIDSIGCYVPGGRSSLLSTLLMSAVPAQVAGVPRIVAVCPKPNDQLLAAANCLGVKEIARLGGPQAIAALAYGTRSVPRVEKIFGPGNKYVTAAKQMVSGDCAIDLPAGPTEAIVLADTGNPAFIAADLIAQAEHAHDAASFLVTTSGAFARQVAREVCRQLTALSPANSAQRSIESAGAILVAPTWAKACDFVNRFAPEHLTMPSRVDSLIGRIRCAGTVFRGPFAAQPLGDYISGSNHVLPTGGWARRRGGLSASDFVKCISVQRISREGFARLADGAEVFAAAEGLEAHANAVRIRR
jgi:histidinol dehydrogenase